MSAILVIVADRNQPNFATIALIPVLLFLALDAYYLALEKGYRDSYNEFVKRLHSGSASVEDLYDVQPFGDQTAYQIRAFKSFSIWGFYVALAVLIEVVRSFVFQ